MLERKRYGTKESCSTTATATSSYGQEDLEDDRSLIASEIFARAGWNSSTNSSSGLYAEPTQTLLFLDWDDTLFPTSGLFEKWGLPAQSEEWKDIKFSQAQEDALERWRCALHDYLCTASALCESCVIVTNAKRPWIEMCISFFAPDLEPLLFGDTGSGPRVVYAREAFAVQAVKYGAKPNNLVPARLTQEDAEEDYHSRLKDWKYAAMRYEAERFYAKYPGQTWKNILSQGDMFYEYNAVKDLSFRRCGPSRERLRTKAIVVPTSPSIENLTWELRTWHMLLPVLVCFDGDVDLDLESVPAYERQRIVSEALWMPSLEGLMPAHHATTEEEATFMLDELAQTVQQHLLDG